MDNLHDSNKSMTTQTEALKLALEALEYYDKPLKEYSAKTARDKDFKAIAAIKEALAQPEQEPTNLERHERNVQKFLGTQQPKEPEQEPVAWRVRWPKMGGGYAWVMNDAPLMAEHGFINEPLYTTPPQRKPLTVAEVEQILAQHNYEIHGDRARYIVRMAEAAHGIKE